MADYHSPTVIQPDLPLKAISPLEHLLLTTIFDHEVEGDYLYLFAELGFDLRPEVAVESLREALEGSDGFDSQVTEPVRLMLAGLQEPDGDDVVELHIADAFEDALHLVMLQDIVRRADGIDWFTVTTSYTCTRMRPDGFGGRASLVTANLIRSRSTEDLFEEFIAEAKV